MSRSRPPAFVPLVAERLGAVTVPMGSAGAKIAAVIRGEAEVYVSGGRKPTGLRVVDWAREAEQCGAGEILLTSMDTDGMRNGFDCELTARVSAAVQIPVIASGGAGTAAHFAEVFRHGANGGKADAALAASIFHFGITDSRALKAELQRAGVSVRLPC